MAASHAVELIGNRLDVKPEAESGEAIRRIPPTAVDAGSVPGTRISADGDVPECDCLESRRAQGIGLGDELLRGHLLDEYAFGESVDRPKHSAELAFPKQIDRLVIVKRGIRGEKPVVSGGRA